MIVARASDYDQNWFPYWIILCLRLMTFSPRLILPILSNRLISKNKFSGASFWPAAKSDKNGSTPFQIWLHCRRSSRSSFHHPTIAKHLKKSPGLVVMGGDSCFEGRGFESHFLAKHLNKNAATSFLYSLWHVLFPRIRHGSEQNNQKSHSILESTASIQPGEIFTDKTESIFWRIPFRWSISISKIKFLNFICHLKMCSLLALSLVLATANSNKSSPKHKSACSTNCATTSVTSKKSPNVYKSCPKIISLEKWKILTPLQKLPKNVGD